MNHSKHKKRLIGALCLLAALLTPMIPVSATELESCVISAQMKTNTLRGLFDLIESEFNYSFLIRSNDLNLDERISIAIENKTVEEILTKALKNQKATFKVKNNRIIVYKAKDTKSNRITGESLINQQQTKKIQGTVLDATTGDPIIGANIVVKGTTIGISSDLDGKFTLEVPENTTLTISYIGYFSKEIKPTESNIVVRLSEDTQTLEEVIVVGYGTQKKENLSGAVAQISSQELKDRPITNLSTGIQGLMPGVTVTAGQGRPGDDGGTIRVRGVGTLNSSNPYILIDGIESGSMNQVDPNDIESISVLKDASSAAIYGSKASNGVILITTKRGSTGKPKISYSGYVGIQNPTQTIERLSSADYATLYNAALIDNGKAARFTDEDIQKFRDGSSPYTHPNTDWYDLAYKAGVQHKHNVNINGGNEYVKYMASAGYLNQEGILANSEREQFNGRMNLDVKLTDRLTARGNLSYIKNDYKDPNSSYGGGSSDQIIRQLNVIAPWIVNKYEDGTYGTISDGNPIAWLELDQTVDRYNKNFTGILAFDYQITDFLKATVQGSYVNNDQHYKSFQKFIQYNPNKSSEPNNLTERNYVWDRTNYDILLNYDQKFGLHGLKGLLGWHTEKYNYRYDMAYRKNFPNNDLTDINAGDASTQKNEGYTRELSMLSWFARVNYDYAGKYLLEGNIRSDASSRFADGHRWGYFPSFSAAWRITEEAFMADTKNWLTNLKIRGSWGLLGNQDALSGSTDDYYPWMNTYNLGASYPFDGSLNSGYYQSAFKIATISWEKSRTWGLGIDFTLFDHIDGSIDYYNRKTTDIIMEVPVPDEFALDPYKDNVGSMSNQGIEISLGYNNRWGDWSLSVNGNFAYNKNKILDLGGVDYMTDPNNSNMRREVGQAINSYYVYKADGFFQSDADAKAYMDKFAGQAGYPFSKEFKAGDLIYSDTNNDGKITADDRVLSKSTNPKYTFGLNINAGYRDFDLSLIFTGAADVGRIYNNEAFGDFKGDNSHPSTIWLDAWTPENAHAKMPRIAEGTSSPSHPSNTMSTFWLQNTSYLRLKNLQVGYTLPKSLLKAIKIENLRVYYSVENLLTFDSMPINLDPESNVERGSAYPLIQTHSFGLNISF